MSAEHLVLDNILSALIESYKINDLSEIKRFTDGALKLRGSIRNKLLTYSYR